MSFPVAFHPAAREEFVEAAAWYEAQRSDLGVEFISEIDRCIMLAADQPKIYPPGHKGIRRVVASRFPYCIYFRSERSRIVVLAVFHSSRDPAIWRIR